MIGGDLAIHLEPALDALRGPSEDGGGLAYQVAPLLLHCIYCGSYVGYMRVIWTCMYVMDMLWRVKVSAVVICHCMELGMGYMDESS